MKREEHGTKYDSAIALLGTLVANLAFTHNANRGLIGRDDESRIVTMRSCFESLYAQESAETRANMAVVITDAIERYEWQTRSDDNGDAPGAPFEWATICAELV